MFFCDLKLSEKISEGLTTLKCSKGEVEVISQDLSSSIRTLVHFKGAVKEEIEQSEFSKENSRNHENCKIQRSYKVDKEGRIHHSGNRSQRGSLIVICWSVRLFREFGICESGV
jgi:hypothetical protein